jgi:DNA helicase II / ATP-dependent DNA helicase PcrA
MKAITPGNWVPSDDMELEENAMDAIQTSGNALVVAGPGAGKTELLAQKACYLLLTTTCLFPKKILAISFKRDAAFNLKERVKVRAGDQLSQRFDSFTFDAFAKLILDRFGYGLPDSYKIKKDYEIFFSPTIIKDIVKGIDETFYHTTSIDFNSWLTSSALPISGSSQSDTMRAKVWTILARKRSMLSFPMIMRLATLVMESNPILRSYLQQTYSHVFLDEFQDTTSIQYEFLHVCFKDSDANYTAVGDDKQNIMAWAGSIKGIFGLYEKEMDAKRYPLIMNFRSAPKLVELQNHLVKELLHKTEFAIPSKKWNPDQGEAVLYYFKDQQEEKEMLLKEIKKWVKTDNINPRDICILVKQRPINYASEIIEHLNNNGLQARNEQDYQDFLTEEAIILACNLIHLTFNKKVKGKSEIVFRILAGLHSQYDDDALLRVHIMMTSFCKKLRAKYKSDFNADAISHLVEDIFGLADIGKLKATYPQYKNGTFLQDCINRFTEFLIEESKLSKDIIQSLERVEGKDSIPVMTIHKSKGLEYHTVIFVGLEDGAFFSYDRQADQDKNAFFVALSRAKERVVFTFSNIRNTRGRDEKQSTEKIQEIFKPLESSKIVEVFDFRNSP